MFKPIKIIKNYDYYIDVNIVDDTKYLMIDNFVFSAEIVDSVENQNQINFTQTVIDDYTIRFSLSDTETDSLLTGDYKYKIDYIDSEDKKRLALYGDLVVVNAYEL